MPLRSSQRSASSGPPSCEGVRGCLGWDSTGNVGAFGCAFGIGHAVAHEAVAVDHDSDGCRFRMVAGGVVLRPCVHLWVSSPCRRVPARLKSLAGRASRRRGVGGGAGLGTERTVYHHGMSEEAERFEVLIPEHLEQHIGAGKPLEDPTVAGFVTKAFMAAGFERERWRYRGHSYGSDGYRLLFDAVNQAD